MVIATYSFRHYGPGATTHGGPAKDLSRLADPRERGILTDEEFERAKAKVLA